MINEPNTILALILAACDDACLENKIPQFQLTTIYGNIRLTILANKHPLIEARPIGVVPVGDDFLKELIDAMEYAAKTRDTKQVITRHVPKGKTEPELIRFIVAAEKMQITFE